MEVDSLSSPLRTSRNWGGVTPRESAKMEVRSTSVGCGFQRRSRKENAIAARQERMRLESQTLELATRVKNIEVQVREKQRQETAAFSEAEDKVAELLWEVEGMRPRDAKIADSLLDVRSRIVAKKREVAKELGKVSPERLPAKKGAQHFRLAPRGYQEASRSDPAAKLPEGDKPVYCPEWREIVCQRAEDRMAQEQRLRERAVQFRTEIRGSSASAYSTARSDMGDGRTPRITREAWLRAYAEENNADLDTQLRTKEAELKDLEAGILKKKEMLKNRASIAEKRHHELEKELGPTYRTERNSREKHFVAGTKEVEYFKQALQCIPVGTPLGSTLGSARLGSTLASTRLSAIPAGDED